MMNTFDAYLDNIKAQVAKVPRDAALAVAQHIFQAVVEKTKIDSGQAALNWHIQPYATDFAEIGQEMLWGYGSVAPISPAGYKWSKVDNSEAVFLYQFEYMMNQVSLAPENLRGVMIYNPIESGHPDFAPGSDVNYEYIALGGIDFAGIVANAVSEVEASYNIL